MDGYKISGNCSCKQTHFAGFDFHIFNVEDLNIIDKKVELIALGSNSNRNGAGEYWQEEGVFAAGDNIVPAAFEKSEDQCLAFAVKREAVVVQIGSAAEDNTKFILGFTNADAYIHLKVEIPQILYRCGDKPSGVFLRYDQD